MKLRTSPALRSMWKRIHPPLPLEPKQAQKLQSLLSASFRKRLDEEHPYSASSRSHLTDAHIKRVLNNPLFKSQGVHITSTNQNDTTGLLGQLQTSLCSPREIFETEIAMGQATVRSATTFLVQTRAQISRSGKPWTAEEATQSINLVLNWLWGNGLEDSLEFIYDHDFVVASVRFLVKSGKDDVFWRWWQRMRVQDTPEGLEWESASNDAARKNLLKTFVLAKYHFTKNPDTAVKALLDASSNKSNERTSKIVGTCVCEIASHLSLWCPEGWTLSHDAHQALSNLVNLQVKSNRRARASLALFAPMPSPLLAWSLLKNANMSTAKKASDRKLFTALVQRTATTLRAHGDSEKADFLLSKFPSTLESSHGSSSAPAGASSQPLRKPATASTAYNTVTSQKDGFNLCSG